ncbi:MAG: glycosyl hydrolase family 18 protein [Clostridia bacterium]
MGPILMFLCFLALVVVSIGVWYWKGLPSTERVSPYDGRQNVIVYEGEAFPQSYQVTDGEILLPFEFIKQKLDPDAFWDEPSNSLIVTTKDKVVQMESDQLTAYMNKKPVSLRIPVTEEAGVHYVPYSPLEKLYPFTLQRNEQTNVLIVEKHGTAVQQAKILPVDGDPAAMLPLRTGPSLHEPFTTQLSVETQVNVFAEKDGWFHVQTSDGLIGYVPKETVELTKVRTVVSPKTDQEKQPVAWKPLGKKIVLAWEHVVKKTPSTSEIADMPGLNVVSPTWFELTDAKGTIANKADAAYVKWAHSKGYKVWGLVSNGFNADWTKAVLGSFELREKMIEQILHYANMYNLDGINLDFENVYVDEKEKLVQFVRELTPYLHEQGLTVSMDITVKSSSDRWSRFYDRAKLAQTVDYVAVMTYDEHWASSPVAGSVASLPWTEEGLQGVLEEVPHKKLLLGVPFYTRLWTEEPQANGSVKVSSKALSMPRAQAWMKERGLAAKPDEKSGQLFVSYKDPKDGKTYKMWLEDATSMQKRMDLVHKYKLAGAAAWRRGFETEDIWTTIEEQLQPGK